MTKLPAELEALMPEPATHRYMSHGHSSRWQLAGKAVPPDAEPLFTADQVRQAMLDATERAAKKVEDTDVVDVAGPNSYYCQLGDAAATRAACAAAIRGDGGQR